MGPLERHGARQGPLAAHGAKVIVNDLGTGRDGRGADASRAGAVENEIAAAGGEAVANSEDAGEYAKMPTKVRVLGV